MGIKLHDYQLEAVERMANGHILCGDVGSGKSRTGIAYYFKENGGGLDPNEYIPMHDPPQDLYIITTARKRDTLEWDDDLCPFLLSSDSKTNLYRNKVVVDSWNNIGKYTEIANAFFIFDEQRLVGSGAWVKAFYKIAKKNNWILLSATPGDKWEDYIPVFIANDFYRSKREFVDEHIVYRYGTKFPQVDRYLNTRKLVRLRDNILVDMDFHRKTVAHNEDIPVSFNKTIYLEIVRNRWDPWRNGPIENASQFCFALRRVVNSDESRQLRLLEILEDHPKAIIFYNFDYELKILQGLYYGDGVEIAEWNGHKHQPIPNGDRWVYLVQYVAGAEGWNCIATDTIIFYSQTYSYKVLKQASGRIDRLNTPYTDLYYYHLKSKAGIDLAISRALKDKKQFNEGRFVNKQFPSVMSSSQEKQTI